MRISNLSLDNNNDLKLIDQHQNLHRLLKPLFFLHNFIESKILPTSFVL